MLIIDKFRLHLPAQMYRRAAPIARLVAREMASIHQKSNLAMDMLRPPVVWVHASFSDQQIARRISDEIQTHIRQSSVESC